MAHDSKGPPSFRNGSLPNAVVVPEVAHTLTSNGHDASEDGTGRGTPIVAFKPHQSGDARSIGEDEHVTPTLSAASGGNMVPAIAFGWNKSPSQTMRCDHECTETLQASESSNPAVMHRYGIRRITPAEAERLQGFPDGWTAWGIGEDGKRVTLKDGPRYRMMGNAVTVNVAEWIGRRIAAAFPESATTDARQSPQPASSPLRGAVAPTNPPTQQKPV